MRDSRAETVSGIENIVVYLPVRREIELVFKSFDNYFPSVNATYYNFER